MLPSDALASDDDRARRGRYNFGEVLLKKSTEGSGTESDASEWPIDTEDLRMSPDGAWWIFDGMNNDASISPNGGEGVIAQPRYRVKY